MLITSLLFSNAGPTMADVRPPNLSRLLGVSDLVIYGKIADVGGNTFRVEILSVLVGVAPLRDIDVSMPRRWPDEPRWVPYEVGQPIVLFLGKRVSNHDTGWQIAGPFGRGEFPTDADFVYLPEHYESFGKRHPHRVYGAEVLFQRVNIWQFFSAVREYSECFVWKKRDKPGAPKPAQICNEVRVTAYASRSPVHRYLATETQDIILRNSKQSE